MKVEGVIKNKGAYGLKRIYYRFETPSKISDAYYVFFHGSFSSSFNSEKDKIITDRILKQNLGNVFVYETSRNVYSFETRIPFEEYKKTFSDKTFSQELTDVGTVFSYFFRRFFKKTDKSKIVFVGFSLGGTQCSYLLPKYGSYIDSVFLFGSGITTKAKGSTYPGYPNKNEILHNFSLYKGNIFLIQGDLDTVVPQDEAKKILYTAHKARHTELIKLAHVDHSFRNYKGKLAISKIATKIFEILEQH